MLISLLLQCAQVCFNSSLGNQHSNNLHEGGEGMGGISLLVIERGPGVSTRKMNCMGIWLSGTAYVTFEDVKVRNNIALAVSSLF